MASIVHNGKPLTGRAKVQAVDVRLAHLDKGRRDAINATRHKSITVADDVPFLHLALITSFTANDGSKIIPLSVGSQQGAVAVLLALEHLNTGNGTLVEEVADLPERCRLKFTGEIQDSATSEIKAANQAVELVQRADPRYLPSAYIGGYRSTESFASSLITGPRGYPQVSPTSTSAELSNKNQFPLFGRTLPSDVATSEIAIRYLREELGVKHLAIIHVNDSYGNGFAAGLQTAAAMYASDMSIQAYSFQYDITPEAAKEKVELLKRTEYQYIFGILYDFAHFETIMTEAYQQGIAGTGKHHWMFSDSVSLDFLSDGVELHSPLHLATFGASKISAMGGVPGRNDRYDRFLSALRDLNNADDIELLQTYFPNEASDYSLESESFDLVVSPHVPFYYDATIALGLSACSSMHGRNGTYFDGKDHFASFLNTEFDGVSGANFFDHSGSRTAASTSFSVYNFVEKNTIGSMVYFKTLVTDVFEDDEWLSLVPLQFNDGTTIPPPSLPSADTKDVIYVGAILRIIGFVQAGCILALAARFGYWTFENRKKRVVRASQPIFLGIITAGCALMSFAIIFLSLDDELVSSDASSAFCIAIPCFLSYGWILVFSALFAKTKRVNTIFHNPNFHRIKVTVRDVAAPIIGLQTVVTVILILWAVIAPPEWVRSVTEVDLFGRATETKGQCSYANSEFFYIPLGLIHIGVLFYTLQQAYVARNVSTEFAESEYIFLLLAAILVVSFMGIPTLFIAQDEPRASFFVATALVFVVCTAVMLLIFIPKVMASRKKPKPQVYSMSSYNNSDRSRPFQIGGLSIARPATISSYFFTSNKIIEDGVISEVEDSDEEENDGAKVLQHPKEVEKLKEKVENLQNRNDKLMTQLTRLRRLQNRTQARLNMNASPDDSSSLQFSGSSALSTPSAFSVPSAKSS
ncbi:MAG: hypothetical protein SGBAC_007153 [Bacillariaceae sp.]